MKRSFIILTVLALFLAAVSTGCRELPDKLSEAEEEKAISLLDGMGYSGPGTQVSLLYDKNESPTYLLAVSDNGYAIIGRSNMKLIEAGEGNPYGDYMELKKYYSMLSIFVVYDPSYPDTPFHSLRSNTFGATFDEAVNE